MKPAIRGFSAFVITALVFGLAMAAEMPGRDDYAWGFALETTGDSEFFETDIPLEVYRSVSDPNMRDAGVYNADGQPVPRLIERPAAADEDLEQPIPLGIVPLHGDQPDSPEQLRLLLRRNVDGTVLELDAPEYAARDPENAADKPLVAYIVDTREIDRRLEYLELAWLPQPSGFMGTVTVEVSNDLRAWRTTSVATVADLSFDETRIGQNRVEFQSRTSDFLRITWHNMPETWALESVTGIHISRDAPVERKWQALDPQTIESTEREYIFDMQGYPPVDRAAVLLPEENVVVRASIFYRHEGEDYWRRAGNGIFYNITRQGTVLLSDPVAFGNVRASHWKVRFDSGSTNGQVSLLLGWRPDKLVFLAQGAPPFELVAGRARDRLEQFPQHSMLGDASIFRTLRDFGQPGLASVGRKIEIAGRDQLEIAATASWRIALLWGGLVAAVLLVGWLVWSLMREMREAGA